ncbi:hypothetical protein BU24DRAFT_277130 [Aaosphaeria arxii CBS 175.79]|uniref:Uncharacterized protein n=1 Tax=Aaosphaeria arxii CBS 175.79 TaxID=1450172 RepID=A0A6A5XDY0_9PLEO|nr:uncharacterized protein BU24DRAFT_277130 [Aaosphaeria arxii CBS 175.79]KAF2011232.1 hypothetical protein BU24DRAFT_277130 [Aaosphaeria arxii CBS 175.79]
MPVARHLGAVERKVDYVIVKRSRVVGGGEEEDEVHGLGAFEPGSIGRIVRRHDVDNTLPKFNLEAAAVASDYDSDGDDSDDEDILPASPVFSGQPTITVTLSPNAQQAQATAFPDRDPTVTGVKSVPPPPPPPREKGGISQTTQHLLIAAGSIGATIVIVMIILGIYTMRKRGLSFSEASRQVKNRAMGRRPAPPPKQASGWQQDKKPYMDDYDEMRQNTVTPPQRAASIPRSGSISSQRPLQDIQRNDSINRQVAQRSSPQQSSFLLDSPPPRRNNSHRRDISETPSSPVLPLQQTNDSRSQSSTSLPYFAPDQPLQQDRSQSPLPPPPTFKQFLSNRPSASQKNSGFGNMVSRFSWTNSNAPQTPHDVRRDTQKSLNQRDSFMTQRSSVPRFRTVDSWVNQQANRVEVQKLKEQFRLTSSTTTSTTTDDEADRIPSVPTIPRSMTQKQSLPTIPAAQQLNTTTPTTPKRTPSTTKGLPGKNVRHERHDTVDTAPIFRQHPGTEVRFSTRSVVASEILDMGNRPNVLS